VTHHCACGKELSGNRRTCHSCVMRRNNADPAIRAKIEAGLRASPAMQPGGSARLKAGRKGAATRWANPEYRERMTRIFKEKVQPLSFTPEGMAKRDEVARGRAVSETKMRLVPPEYRPLYRSLIYKKIKKADALRMVEEQRRRDLANLSPFERQERALANGARLVANDVKPSLDRPGLYEERKAG
jgi:hypothetical protein